MAYRENDKSKDNFEKKASTRKKKEKLVYILAESRINCSAQ